MLRLSGWGGKSPERTLAECVALCSLPEPPPDPDSWLHTNAAAIDKRVQLQTAFKPFAPEANQISLGQTRPRKLGSGTLVDVLPLETIDEDGHRYALKVPKTLRRFQGGLQLVPIVDGFAMNLGYQHPRFEHAVGIRYLDGLGVVTLESGTPMGMLWTDQFLAISPEHVEQALDDLAEAAQNGVTVDDQEREGNNFLVGETGIHFVDYTTHSPQPAIDTTRNFIAFADAILFSDLQLDYLERQVRGPHKLSLISHLVEYAVDHHDQTTLSTYLTDIQPSLS